MDPVHRRRYDSPPMPAPILAPLRGIRLISLALGSVALGSCAPPRDAPAAATTVPSPPTPPPAAEPREDSAIVGWVDQHLVPLTSTDPSASTDDLVALDPFLHNRRVVAMGESTHGTKEFFDLKHRFFRYLVEHHDYTVMAMELPLVASARLDDYVAGVGAEDDVVELVQRNYWFLDSEEYIALFRWMRQHNTSVQADRRLEVFGFDTQAQQASAAALAQTLAGAHPKLSRRHGALLSRLSKHGPEGNVEPGPALQALDELAAALEPLHREARLDDRTIQHVEILRAHLDTVAHCGDRVECSVAKRDMYMAQNLRRHLERTNAKALVWAHNGHVDHALYPDGWMPMGHHLSQWLGDELYVIGFEFDHGGFVAPAGGELRVARSIALAHLRGFTVAEYVLDDPAPPGTLPHVLAQARSPVYFLPLSADKAPEVERWFEHTRARHEYGGFPPPAERRYTDDLPVTASYDALVFVEETHGYTFVR